MAKKYTHLEKDFMFKSQLGLDYFSDNPFKINQEMDVINKRKESVTAMAGLVGDEEKPYFSNAFLIETFLGMSRQDIIANKEAMERKAKEKKKAEDKEGGEKGEEGEEKSTQVTL
jgi:hypothetical protein